MKTTTIRLDDDQVSLLEELAKADGCRTSDVMRAAIRDYIDGRAAIDAAFEARRTALAERRMAGHAKEVRDSLGKAALPEFEVTVGPGAKD